MSLMIPANLLTPEVLENVCEHRYTPSTCDHPDSVVVLDAMMEATQGGVLAPFPLLPIAESPFSNLADWFEWAVPSEIWMPRPALDREDRTYLFSIRDTLGKVTQYWGRRDPDTERYAYRCRTLSALDRLGLLPTRPQKG